MFRLWNKRFVLLLESDVVEEILEGLGEIIGKALGGVWENISKKLWDVFLTWVVDSVNEFCATIITQISHAPLLLFAEPSVQAILDFFSYLGWALFIMGLVLAVFEICIEYQSAGHFNIKRQFLPPLIGLFAVMLFDTVPILLYQLAVDQQSALMELVIVGSGVGGNSLANLQTGGIALIHNMSGGDGVLMGTLLYCLILLIVYIYSVVKVFFANIKRGGILFAMIAVGSLYMISIPRGYTDGFWSWAKQIVGLCVTTVLQNVILCLGCVIVSKSNILVGIGVMLAASEVPRIAGHFGLDTSSKASFSSIAYSANSAISAARGISQLASKAV